MTHVVEFPKLGLQFTVNETAFSIGTFEVRWYGVIIAVGFLLAILYAWRMSSKMHIDMDRLLDAVLVGLIGAVVCARLFYVIFYPGDTYRNDPMEIFNIHNGGLAIYGGVIGALVFGGLMAKIRKLHVLAVLDVTVIGFLIGQCVGRWGNFVNQEAFGSATDLPWGMYSDNTQLVVPGANVHPCFLYESLLCLLGFVLLHFFNLKLRRYDGQTFLLYIVWYGACRFFIEGLRTDSLMIPHTGLRVSQVLAGTSAVIGVILLIALRRRTGLTGCGDARVMEAVGLLDTEIDADAAIEAAKSAEAAGEDEDAVRFSTIFGNAPADKPDHPKDAPAEDVGEEEESEAVDESGESPAEEVQESETNGEE